jgi:hypothetical protein
MEKKVIYPYLCIGTYGTVLNDFRTNVKLSVEEMDEIIINHHFTRDSLEETHRLLKQYQAKDNHITKTKWEKY